MFQDRRGKQKMQPIHLLRWQAGRSYHSGIPCLAEKSRFSLGTGSRHCQYTLLYHELSPVLLVCVQASGGDKDIWYVLIFVGPDLMGCLIACPPTVAAGGVSMVSMTVHCMALEPVK